MQTNETGNVTKTKQTLNQFKEIIVDFDKNQIDFDDISFKPLTDGLGFNSNEKKSAIQFKRTPQNIPKITSLDRDLINEKMGVPHYLKQKNSKQTGITQDLHIFKTEDKRLFTQKKESEQVLAKRYKTFLAWIFDVIIIIIFVSTTIFAFLFSPGIETTMLLSVIDTGEIITFLVGIFSTYYLIYFSLLDYFTTPGKYLSKIQLVSNNGHQVTILNCMIRSTASLLSFLALGLPFIMDFQGKLSETKIVER